MKNTTPPTQEYSLSSVQAKSIRSSDVIELGERIVAELLDDRSSDILVRWMAHTIAEKIKLAETSEGDERTKATSDCCDLILRVWAQRQLLPNGKRPFESFERIFRTLETLEDRAPRYRYVGRRHEKGDFEGEPPAVEQWVRLAEQMDEAAREVVKHCLNSAADAAFVGKERWAKIAAKVSPDELDVTIVLQLVDALGQLKDEHKDAVHQEADERIERLQRLVSVSNEIIDGLKRKGRKPAKARIGPKPSSQRSNSGSKPPS